MSACCVHVKITAVVCAEQICVNITLEVCAVCRLHMCKHYCSCAAQSANSSLCISVPIPTVQYKISSGPGTAKVTLTPFTASFERKSKIQLHNFCRWNILQKKEKFPSK